MEYAIQYFYSKEERDVVLLHVRYATEIGKLKFVLGTDGKNGEKGRFYPYLGNAPNWSAYQYGFFFFN